MMTNYRRNIINCCNSNNTHRGAPRTGKQTCACASDLGDASHVTCLIAGKEWRLCAISKAVRDKFSGIAYYPSIRLLDLRLRFTRRIASLL